MNALFKNQNFIEPLIKSTYPRKAKMNLGLVAKLNAKSVVVEMLNV